MNLPEDILSERIGQYRRGTQMAIDGERPVAFIGYINPDGSGEGNWAEPPAFFTEEFGDDVLDPRHDSFDNLMAAHRCEHCMGAGWTREAPEPEEGFWLPFLTLVICAAAFTLWMFWAATAVAP